MMTADSESSFWPFCWPPDFLYVFIIFFVGLPLMLSYSKTIKNKTKINLGHEGMEIQLLQKILTKNCSTPEYITVTRKITLINQ